jgi:hypothetical protein
LPLSQENVQVVGVAANPLPHLVETLIEDHLKPFLETEADTHV